MSIGNIVQRLRESRIQEATSNYEYKFDIPWRETITSDYEEEMYHYNHSQMDYAGDIMSAAMEDFNDISWSEYTSEDDRVDECGILRMSMEFNEKGNCIINVLTSKVLSDTQIESVIDYLTGQMSDGWGEGFEQKEIAKFKEETEEWVEDEDSEEGGYYDWDYVTYYVAGQFWWPDTALHPYGITLVSSPADDRVPTHESVDTEDTQRAEYVCKKVVVDPEGVMEIICYDTVEDEEFEKYIGQVENPSARKNARLLLRDWKFEVPKDIKNELIGTFGLEDFGYSIEESNKPMEFATDSEAYDWARENGYKITKIQNGTGEKACLAWMRELDESGYLSSFDRDVMRAVNELAPGALHWKDGDQILATNTGYVATFRGYLKSGTTGRYKAVFEFENEGKLETYKYDLVHLQRDIDKGIYVNQSK